ncbi:MAG TPA: class I SAM-dependent methyltransferase, partial [Thermoanaerobaculia bacterium]
GWWREQIRQKGVVGASTALARELWGFVRDSTPERRRGRYGDMEYDWEHRVNTTSGTVGWRGRLLGVFHSPYQPTEPALFREMMASLPIDFREFTFVDLGSGKGRTLLMASEFPFRRIVGVEILPELNRAAQENIRVFKSAAQKCTQIESVCADAREFVLPEEPLVLYLFNPLPEAALRQVMQRLQQSGTGNPKPLWIVYHNPLLEAVLADLGWLVRAGGTERYVVYGRRFRS